MALSLVCSRQGLALLPGIFGRLVPIFWDMASPVKKALLQKHEYLKCNVHAGMDTTGLEFTKRLAKMTEEMLAQITRAPRVSDEEATACLTLLNEGVFLETHKVALAKALNAKVVSDDSTAGRCGLQKHLYMHRYMTQSDWNTLRSLDTDFNKKIKVISTRCLTLGLAHPTEATMVHLVAILVLGTHTGPADQLQVRASDGLAYLRDLKVIVKSMRQRYPAGDGCIREFPPTPEELKLSAPKVYDTAYAHGGPCECPLDETKLEILRAQLPARKTHVGVASSSVVTPHQPVFAQNAAIKNFLGGLFSTVRGHAEVELPGFRMCRGDSTPQLLPSTSILALPPPATLPAPSCGPPAIEDEKQEREEQPTRDSKTVAEMVEAMQQALKDRAVLKRAADFDESAETAPLAKTKGKKKHVKNTKEAHKKPAAMKRPAGCHEQAAKKTEGGLLKYPGVPKAGEKRPPMKIGTSTIYTNVLSSCWRLKEKPGDRLDKAYHWKGDGRGEAAWQELKVHAQRVNPGL